MTCLCTCNHFNLQNEIQYLVSVFPILAYCRKVLQNGNFSIFEFRTLSPLYSRNESGPPSTFPHDGWIEYLHIFFIFGTMGADAHKIEFGSVPNLSNYNHFSYILRVCCEISENNVVIFFIYLVQ